MLSVWLNAINDISYLKACRKILLRAKMARWLGGLTIFLSYQEDGSAVMKALCNKASLGEHTINDNVPACVNRGFHHFKHDPKVIKRFSCSTQMSMKLALLITMKMPTFFHTLLN